MNIMNTFEREMGSVNAITTVTGVFEISDIHLDSCDVSARKSTTCDSSRDLC